MKVGFDRVYGQIISVRVEIYAARVNSVYHRGEVIEMEDVYIANTMYLNGDLVLDRQLTCIGEFRQVVNYITTIRRIPVVDSENITNDVRPRDDSTGVVAEITKATFYSSRDRDAYLWNDANEPYVLRSYGDIDVSVLGLPKKYGKGVFIPGVVMDIIDRDRQELVNATAMASRTLKEIFFINGSRTDDEANGQLKILAKTINLLDSELKRFIDQREFSPIFDAIDSRPSILFCGEQEYRNRIRTHLQKEDMLRRYRNIIQSED